MSGHFTFLMSTSEGDKNEYRIAALEDTISKIDDMFEQVQVFFDDHEDRINENTKCCESLSATLGETSEKAVHALAKVMREEVKFYHFEEKVKRMEIRIKELERAEPLFIKADLLYKFENMFTQMIFDMRKDIGAQIEDLRNDIIKVQKQFLETDE